MRVGTILEQGFPVVVHVKAGEIYVTRLIVGEWEDFVGNRVWLRRELIAPPLVKLPADFVGDFWREGECVLQRTAANLR